MHVTDQYIERDLADLEAFCARLDELDEHLTPRERALLDTLFYRAMSPLDRLRQRQRAGVLAPEEQAMLDELAAEGPGD
jgi:hypothetical protein